jgi:coenzyme F420-dependent glucose-6-phosphate dehydrogenase
VTPSLAVGYKASAEQFGPEPLLRFAREAEELGFDTVAVSDHFQPFRHTGGHSPFAPAWLGALAATTERVRIGTSVSTPTMRMHPSIVAHAFGTIACLAPGRTWLGVGTGESLNEVPALAIEWPKFSERLGRLREAVDLIRRLWREDHVTHEGRYYRTRAATIYDRPEHPIPILVAGDGPKAARYAGQAGDGYVATSGKGRELYTERLLPAVEEGLRDAGRDPEALERMMEIKLAYDHDRERALADCRFWAPLALPGEVKRGVDDPRELERLADAEDVRPESRFIVTDDPDEAVERIGEYVDLGFRHLVFHGPGHDQPRFVRAMADDVLPRLRARYGRAAA